MQRDYKSLNNSPWVLDRPDAWSGMFIGPSAAPNVFKPHGYVCRGMNDEHAAQAYARQAAEFFSRNGLEMTVFVVRGPTSTSRRSQFEVTDACSSYPVVASFKSQPPPQCEGPLPGMLLRAAIVTYGLEALRGVPLDVGTGETVYVSNSCLDGDIATWADEPSEAFRITRFYGGDSPDASMVHWISVGTTRIAQTVPEEAQRPAQICRDRG
jgi:hypothetical protein